MRSESKDANADLSYVSPRFAAAGAGHAAIKAPRSAALSLRRIAVRCSGVLIVAGLWEAGSRISVLNPIYLPPPSEIGVHLFSLVTGGIIVPDATVSLAHIAVGVAIGNVIGLVLAAAAARWWALREGLSPITEFTRGLAPLALLPAFLLIFGIGSTAAIAIIVWVAWVPVFINTLEGLVSIDKRLLLAGRACGASATTLTRTVVIPSVLPYYVAGLRLSIGSGFLALIAAEMLGSGVGLGYYILQSSETFHVVDMYAAIALVGLLGVGLNLGVMAASRRALRWRE